MCFGFEKASAASIGNLSTFLFISILVHRNEGPEISERGSVRGVSVVWNCVATHHIRATAVPSEVEHLHIHPDKKEVEVANIISNGRNGQQKENVLPLCLL